jgi:hypothetical protein
LPPCIVRTWHKVKAETVKTEMLKVRAARAQSPGGKRKEQAAMGTAKGTDDGWSSGLPDTIQCP